MKIVRTAFIVLLLSNLSSVIAQNTSNETPSIWFAEFQEWDWSEDKNAVVFADACNVRATPDQKGELLGKLVIGTKVKLLEISKVKLTQNGIESPWIKVSSSSLTGYIWGGTVTKGMLKLKDGKMVLWGLTEIRKNKEDHEEVFASVRICEKGVITLKHDFEVVHATQPEYGYLKVLPSKLEGVQNLIVFNTISDACGVYASMHYLLYTGDKLHFIGSGYSMGDAGLLNTSFQYVFPPETVSDDYRYNPTAPQVLTIENNGTYEEDCSWLETTKIITYTWDGTQLVKYCDQ